MLNIFLFFSVWYPNAAFDQTLADCLLCESYYFNPVLILGFTPIAHTLLIMLGRAGHNDQVYVTLPYHLPEMIDWMQEIITAI